MCADNANGGQYQTSDPSQTTTDNTSITGTVAPTPSGQLPPQPAVQPAQPAAQQPAPSNAPDASSPNPGAAGGQVANPLNKNQAPPAAAPKPLTKTQKLLANARAITDEMAGGDPYKTQIDPTTGATTRVRQPLSPRSISLAIIMEALSGAAAGAGEHGPGALGKAAQAGVQAGQQIAAQRQQNQAQQDQQAETDVRNRQQAVINTLQTRQLAQTLGRQSLEMAQKSVEADSAEWQSHQQDQSSILAQGLSHDDAYAAYNKLPAGSAQVLITGVRPRVDPKTGKPVFQLPNGQIVSEDTPGAYQAPDFTYAVVKPTAKHSIVDNDGNLSPEVQDDVKYGYQQLPPKDANGKYPANFQVDGLAYQAGHRGTQIAKAFNVQINQERASIGLDPIDISKDTAQDSTVRNALTKYNAVLASSHGDHQKAYDAVAGDPTVASAAGTIQNWFGGPDAAKALDAQRSVQDFNTGVLNGSLPLSDAGTLSRARVSSDPKVKAAADAQYEKNQKDALEADRRLKQQDETIRVRGAEAQAAYTHKLQQSDAANSADPAINPLASMLVEGGMDPSQLSRRSKGYDATLVAANAYSQAHYGRPFDIATATSNYKRSQDKGVQGSLSAAGTLFGTNGNPGTLDTLQATLNKIPTGIPLVTAITNPKRYNLGNEDLAALQSIETDVTPELSAFNAGSGGNQTDKRLELAGRAINPNSTAGQIQAQLKIIRQAASERMSGITRNNPYIQTNATGINDPVTRKPNSGRQQNQPSANQPQAPQLTNIQRNPQTGQRIGWNGSAWVDASTNQPIGGK